MLLQQDSMVVTTTTYGCPTGRVLLQAVNIYVGALYYAFAEFCSYGKLPEFFTDTQRQNHPSACKYQW